MMVKFMKKVPAGTLLVPMILSAILHTFWPNLFFIGGVTEEFLGGGGTNFIIGMLTFASGLGIDLSSVKSLLKRHGTIMLAKILVAVILSLLYRQIFGEAGIFGISAVAFVVAMVSMNPALYISLVDDFGTDLDKAAFGFTGIFSIPVIPVMIYSIGGQGEIDWLPIASTLIPLILGIVLGNLDPEFNDLFDGTIRVLLPVLGWAMGQSVNLIDAFQAGLSGILLAILYYVFMSSLVVTDKYLLKNDGIPAMAMNSVAALSTATPAIIAVSNPEVAPFVSSAIAQILMANLISVVVTPAIVTKMAGGIDEQNTFE